MNTSLWFDDPREFVRNELRSFFGPTATRRGGWNWNQPRQVAGVFPAINLYDNGEGYRIRAEMPGVDKDSLDISCKQDQIVVRGERVVNSAGDDANFHRREREGGQFRRAITLPQPVDAEKVVAEYKHGILDIFAPRADWARPRKVEVR